MTTPETTYEYLYDSAVPVKENGRPNWSEIPNEIVKVETADVYVVEITEEQIAKGRVPKTVVINDKIRLDVWTNTIKSIAESLKTGEIELKLATKLRKNAETGEIDPDWYAVEAETPRDRSPTAAAEALAL